MVAHSWSSCARPQRSVPTVSHNQLTSGWSIVHSYYYYVYIAAVAAVTPSLTLYSPVAAMKCSLYVTANHEFVSYISH